MGNHPGDPRSNANGEIPFDPLEYPYSPHTPAALPPQAGNVNDYQPFLGQNNHGVRNVRDPHDGYAVSDDKPYSSDQAAQEHAVDDTSFRDLIPIKPVPVTIVDRPDLLRRIHARTSSIRIKAGGTPVLIAPADPLRTRLVINVLAFDNVMTYLTTDRDGIEPTAFPVSPYSGQFETTSTSAVYGFSRIVSDPLTDEHGTVFAAWMETPQSNGDPLL